MNDLMETFVFDLQLFANAGFDPWADFDADDANSEGDDIEDVKPEDIKTDPEAAEDGDLIWDQETADIAEGDVEELKIDMSKVRTETYTKEDGTTVTIQIIPTEAVAAAVVSEDGQASLGTGRNSTTFDASGGSITVNFGQDENGNYTGEPTSVTAAAGDTTLGIGGSTSGVGLGIEGATKPVTVGLNKGRPSLLSFLGNLAFTLFTKLKSASGAVEYIPDEDYTGGTITFDGFSDTTDNNYVYLSDNGKRITILDLENKEDGSVTITGAYGYELAVHETQDDGSSEVISAAQDFALDNVTNDSPYVITILEENGIGLNLTNVTASNANKPVSLVEAGGVDVVLPPTAATGGSIKINGTTYEYTTVANSEAGFLLDGTGAATAFFLDANGDAFRTTKSGGILVYDDDDLENELVSEVTATGSGELIFTKTGTGYDLGYVFNAAGDSITVTEEQAETFDMRYVYRKAEYNIIEPEIEGGYTVKMTDKGVFQFSGLEAESEFVLVNASIEFENAGGTVTTVAIPNESTGAAPLTITGITATSGQVYFNDEAAALFEDGIAINGKTITLDDMDAFVYNADTGEIEGLDNVVYAIGDGEHKFNNGTFTVANDADGMVLFTKDDDDNVTAITNLNSGTVTGDFSDGNITVNGKAIQTSDTLLTITGNKAGDGITAISGFDNGTITLGTAEDLTINNTPVAINSTSTAPIVVTSDNSALTITGLASGDAVTVGADTAVVLPTDEAGTITINGAQYYASGDAENVTITGGGVVTGLDENATLRISGDLSSLTDGATVNGKSYTLEQLKSADTKGEDIIGYKSRSGLTSYMEDANHPIINKDTGVGDVIDIIGAPFATSVDSLVSESGNIGPSLASYDFTTEDRQDKRARVYLDKDGDTDVVFNDKGGNVAVVENVTSSTKNITLGNKDDVVIVTGEANNKYSKVNITGGTGDDSIVVQGAMPVAFDMSKGGNDKVITFAEANARITIDGYSDTTGAGIVIHEPEADNIGSAIESGLISFDDGKIVTIDRDENDNGDDRKTEIVVNNKNADHQTLVRMFTYKDTGDTYKDDKGKLVGFTGAEGGKLDASDKSEDVILVGNTTGKNAASELKTGSGDDTIYAGKGDTVNAGTGVNVVKLTGEGGANVVVGEGYTTINNLVTGAEGDIISIGGNASVEDIAFDGSNISISGSGYSAVASVATASNSINQLFDIAGQTLAAALAVEGQDISVSGSEVPDYFIGNAGINFSEYSGDVVIDGKSNWKPSTIGDKEVRFSGGIVSLVGGSGTTQFKGYDANNVLVAGSGATSLYGGGGNNTLVGYTGSDKKAPTEFFVLGNENGARHTIENYQFGTDLINTDFASNIVSRINTDGNDVVLRVSNRNNPNVSETAVIKNAVDAGNIQIGTNGSTVTTGQVGSNSVTVDGKANYFAVTESNSTIKVASDITTKAEIWLDNRKEGTQFYAEAGGSYSVIDGTGSNVELELAGNALANTIIAGNGNTSLWGGAGSAGDVLIGGAGHNSFYYEIGNGADTVSYAKDGDTVNLFNTSIDDITTQITNTGVVINYKAGGSLTVNSNSSIDYTLKDGSTWVADHSSHTWKQKS